MNMNGIKRFGGAILGLLLLIGIMAVSSTTAQAQYPNWNQDQYRRAEQLRRERERELQRRQPHALRRRRQRVVRHGFRFARR